MRPMRAILLLFLCLITGTAVGRVSIAPLQPLEATPGQYVTFAVPLNGDGTFQVSVTAPESWSLVTPSRQVSVAGAARVPFTMRVPHSALAGTSIELVVTATGDGSSNSAQLPVHILGTSGLTVSESSPAESTPGQALAFSITVTNTGNQADTITLSAHSPSQQVLIEPDKLVIGPFQSAQANVLIPAQNRVSDGYWFHVTVDATSANSGSTTRQRIRATYTTANATAAVTASSDPQLVLRITTAASTGLTASEGDTQGFFNWRVQPGLSGDLSDFVQLDVNTDAFRNNNDSFFNLPQYSTVSLTGDDWQAGVRFGPGQFGVNGAVAAAGWRFSVGGRYQRMLESAAIGFDASAVSQSPGLDLQFHGNAYLHDGHHSDSLSAYWRTPLSDNLQLGLGLGVSGSNAGTDEYRVALTVNQNLYWLGQSVDISQSLTSIPGLGFHTLTVSGGSRASYPLGVRFLGRLAVAPAGSTLSTGVQLSSSPLPALRLTAGIHHTGSISGEERSTLRLQAGSTLRFRFSDTATGLLALQAESIMGLTPSSRSGSLFRVSVSSRFSRLILSSTLLREEWQASADMDAELRLVIGADSTFMLSANSDLQGAIQWEASPQPGFSFSLRWRHHWTDNFNSNIAWAMSSGRHTLSAGVAARNVFTRGLSIGAGYGLSISDATVTQRFSVGISYTWLIAFNTPEPLVDAFGGRETGEIHGIAYIDADLDGERSADDQPLAGVTVRAGEVTATTAADGSFSLRVPEGTYQLDFTDLPATYGFTGSSIVTVQTNEILNRDLSFAAVSGLQIRVFLDEDRDGQQSTDEPALPGVPVQLAGPNVINARTNADGVIWLSGLLEGAYTATVDMAWLPRGYELTRALPVIHVSPPESPPALLIPVAPMIRDIVTTYRSGDLAVSAWLSATTVSAGTELTVNARLSGSADAVSLNMFGQSYGLTHGSEDVWSVTFTVPNEPGLAEGVIQANADGQQAETRVRLLVTVPD